MIPFKVAPTNAHQNPSHYKLRVFVSNAKVPDGVSDSVVMDCLTIAAEILIAELKKEDFEAVLDIKRKNSLPFGGHTFEQLVAVKAIVPEGAPWYKYFSDENWDKLHKISHKRFIEVNPS